MTSPARNEASNLIQTGGSPVGLCPHCSVNAPNILLRQGWNALPEVGEKVAMFLNPLKNVITLKARQLKTALPLRLFALFFQGAPMMTCIYRKSRYASVLLMGALLLSTGPAAAQQAVPDWTGVWAMIGGTVFDRASQTGEGGSSTAGVRQHPPYTAEYEARYQANLALRDRGILPDPNSLCGIPTGFPRILNLPDVYEFVVTPKQVWVLAENGPNVLRIYTDGRPHPEPEDRWPTHTGDSVGHWEGDTLVFDTLSLHSSESGRTLLDRTGLILSEEAHIITRMGINTEGLMEAQLTIEDSAALTAPWVVTKQYRRLDEGARVYDYACNENNRNPIDPDTGWTLTIGPDGEVMDLAAPE